MQALPYNVASKQLAFIFVFSGERKSLDVLRKELAGSLCLSLPPPSPAPFRSLPPLSIPPPEPDHLLQEAGSQQLCNHRHDVASAVSIPAWVAQRDAWMRNGAQVRQN